MEKELKKAEKSLNELFKNEPKNIVKKRSWFERFYDFMCLHIHDNKKTIFMLLVLVGFNAYSQEKHTSVMLGYKSIELGASYSLESELVIGLSASVTESGIVEERANKNDMYLNKHDFTISAVPALFFTIGGEFDNFTMIGKLGGAYLEQTINSRKDAQKYYPAVGVIFDYEFNNGYSLRASYDNVSGGLVGIGFNF